METSAQTISNCVKFASSLRNAVGFAVAAADGADIRKDIENGKYAGVSFPKAKKPKSKYTKWEKVGMVLRCDDMRHEGKTIPEAAFELGVSTRELSDWTYRLKEFRTNIPEVTFNRNRKS